MPTRRPALEKGDAAQLSRRELLAGAAAAALALPLATGCAPPSLTTRAPVAPVDGRRRRLRELGIAVGTLPTGRWNAITDVPGVRVGHVTRIEGDGPLVP